MREKATLVPIAGSGRMDGEASAMLSESSARVQSGQVWIERCGGREGVVNSSGLAR